MPWTKVEYNQNTDKDKLGSFVAIHDTGFAYHEERVDITAKDSRDKFVARANEALNAYEAKESLYEEEEQEVLSSLNA
tara:strand:- start:815 stop:1048 length:234 start_codon:yes stop_codon:yes gene_type:complete